MELDVFGCLSTYFPIVDRHACNFSCLVGVEEMVYTISEVCIH
jgi:hypothetical protein